jgi:sulfoxide reductase heme-binding subunit YedZ
VLTWIVLRAAGIASYLMLWATVAWGLIGTTGLTGKRVARATAIAVHQFLATAAFVLLGVHIGGLLLDRFVPFGPLDVAVPLHTTYHTVPVAFGIVAMYALAVVLVSSWARKRLSTRLWRALHLLAVPTFAMALVHGVFAGTDTVRPWMWWGYVATGGSVLFLMLTRALTVGMRPARHPVPEGAAVRRPTSPAPVGTPARPATASPVSPAADIGPRESVPVTPSRVAAACPPPTVVVRVELVIDGERLGHGTDIPVRVERVDEPPGHPDASHMERFAPPTRNDNGHRRPPGS